MRYILTLSILLLGQTVITTAQTTWVVSNMPGFPAIFTDLQAAINSSDVMAGDILLVQGSTVSYGDIEVNKKVIIMGPGYFLGENTETQTNLMSAKVNSIHFKLGSEGSVMQGMEVTGTSITETFYHYCNAWPGNNFSVLIEANSIGIISNRLHQALVIRDVFTGIISKNILNFLLLVNSTSHITVNNNIISGDFTAKNSIVNNNVIGADGIGRYIELSECSLSGNIFYANGYQSDCGRKSIYTKNIFVNDPLGADVGDNIVDVPQADIFIWNPALSFSSSDGRYKVKPNSVASIINAGVFAGLDPYKLSGISLHPNIFSVTMPNTATSGSGLKVEVKVRAND